MRFNQEEFVGVLAISALFAFAQVPTRRCGVGRAHPRPRRPARLFVLAADRGPLPSGPGLQVQRPEFITQKTISGSPSCRAASRSAIAYNRSTRAFFSAYRGSFDAF
jgi:hypothetical protein